MARHRGRMIGYQNEASRRANNRRKWKRSCGEKRPQYSNCFRDVKPSAATMPALLAAFTTPAANLSAAQHHSR